MIRALLRLLPYVVRVRRSLIIGLASVPFATALSIASPWVLKYVVDGLTEGVDRRQLALYAGMLLVLSLCDGACRYVMRTYLIGASRQIEYDLRNEFFAHLERLPQAYFHANRTGDLMSRATNDLGAVRMMVGPAVMYFSSTALGFVAAVSVMCQIDLWLTLIVLMPLPAVVLGTRYVGRAIHDRFEAIQAQLSDMSAVVQEALAGVRVVKAYGQEGAELERFSRANDAYVARNRGLIRLQAGFFPGLTLCFGMSAAALLWFGGRDVMAGRITLGDFVAFGRYLVLLSWPLISFGWVMNLVQRGVASWERMLEVFDALPEAQPVEGLVPTPVAQGRVEARHLTFTYPGRDSPALVDVTFTVEPGQTLAIVGPTGSGKSTLLSLLARWYEPPAGSLWLDEVDVRDRTLAAVRDALGMVPQEPFLFSDTLAGNIAFRARSEWSEAEVTARVRQAADLAGLTPDVAGFPAGLETRVGERGITLSGGQRQRVALARAILADPRILVLDDALSAVDTATEERILKHLRDLRRDRTCLIVAHRISSVRDADLILVLEQGRIVERGTHEALVEAGGTYAAMYRQQLLEEELSRV